MVADELGRHGHDRWPSPVWSGDPRTGRGMRSMPAPAREAKGTQTNREAPAGAVATQRRG